MARLIVKSPYLKGGGKGGYARYIATRDGVELLPSGYMEYMAQRPRSHGLFGDQDNIDLAAAIREVNEYPGNIWTHIISLKREDAERLGYDHAPQWRNLLRAHRNDIAVAMSKLITLPRFGSFPSRDMVLCVLAKEAHDMTKVLKDLFNGDLFLSDRPMPKGSEMYKLSTKLCKCEETLAQGLDEPEKAQLEALTRAQWEMNCLTAEENFILGFRLGVRLMAECLTREEDD